MLPRTFGVALVRKGIVFDEFEISSTLSISKLTAAHRQLLTSGLIALALAAARFSYLPHANVSDADAYLVHVSAMREYDNLSNWQLYSALANRFFQANGWFPIGSLALTPWLINTEYLQFHFLQYVIVLLDFGFFGALAFRLFSSVSMSSLASALALAAWQVRWPHDPVLGTSFVTSFGALVLLAFAHAMLNYTERKNIGSLALLSLAAAAAAFTSAFLLTTVGITALFALVKRSWRAGAALTLIFVSAGVAQVVAGPLRFPSEHPGNYLANVLIQVTAALPLTFRVFASHPVGNVPSLYHAGWHYIDDRFVNIAPITLMGWIFVLVASAVVIVSITMSSFRDNRANTHTALVGALLWLGPSVLLGGFDQWRGGFSLGQAYDVVFFEYFGVALIAVWLLESAKLTKPASAFLAPLAALAVFFISYGNVRDDNTAVARAARLDRGRSLMQRAASAGLFQAVPQNSIIAVDQNAPYATGIHDTVSDAKYAIYKYSHRRFKVVSERSAPAGAWILLSRQRTGFVSSLVHKANTGPEIMGDEAYGFTVLPNIQQAFIAPLRGLKAHMSTASDGKIIHLVRTCGPVPIDEIYRDARPSVNWGSGFWRKGPVGYAHSANIPPLKGNEQWDYEEMFMEAKATMDLIPSSCAPTTVNIRALAVAAVTTTITVISPNHRDEVLATPAGVPFTLTFTRQDIRPRKPIRIVFETKTPESNIDPINFRYEKDRPRHIRAAIVPTTLWEDIQ